MSNSAGRIVLSIIISSLLLAVWHVEAQTCYYPDRTVEPSHTACNTSAENSSLCCQLGASCLTSGLCFSQWDTSLNTGTCTDKTWTDPACFQQCPPSPDTGDHGFHTLYRCNDNRWCCSAGPNTTSCCDDGGIDLFELKNISAVMGGTGFVAGFTIGAMASMTPSATNSNTAIVSATSPSNGIAPTSTRPQSSGAIVNVTDAESPRTESAAGSGDGVKIGLGVGLPLLAICSMIALFFLRRRVKGRSKAQKGEDFEKEPASASSDGDTVARHEPQEVESLPLEMPNGRREITQELGT